MNEAEAVSLEGEEAWLRMSIVRYQFPQTENDEWDSNWLIIEGHVSLGGRIWEFGDPCLTTFEAIRLADWMDAQAKGTAEQALCAFTEPILNSSANPTALFVSGSHMSLHHLGRSPITARLNTGWTFQSGQNSRWPLNSFAGNSRDFP